VQRLCAALQLNDGEPKSLIDYKKAFTAGAIREIYESIHELWPPDLDITAALSKNAEEVSGLYIGDYDLDYITRGLVRHSIYANKILVCDPFIYPRSVRDHFNPILNPAQHRAQTLKNANFWFALRPWIDAGIVEVIRTPGDFDHRLNWESMKRQEDKFANNPALAEALERTKAELSARHTDRMGRLTLLLGSPDSYLKRLMKELDLESEGFTAADFIEHVQRQRDSDPNFLEPLGASSSGQLHMMSSGAGYDMARLTANITNSYLVTDLHSKWREIEIDRETSNAETKVWSPFAKSVQTAPFKYLNNLALSHALSLREEGRLDSMRAFLFRVWKAARTTEHLDEENGRLLSEELGQELIKADEEWKKIDIELSKFVAAELGAGLLAAGPLIAAGQGAFVAAAAVTAGVANLAVSTAKRKSFPDRHPAAFFMKIERPP
jgi:hypothetical protein